MQIPHPHQGFFELMRKLHSRGSSAPSALRCCPDQTLGLSESLESFISVKLQLFPQTVGGKACASMDTGQCQPRGDAGSFSPRNSFPSHRFRRVTHHPSHWRGFTPKPDWEAQEGHWNALTSCRTVTFLGKAAAWFLHKDLPLPGPTCTPASA